MRLKGLSTGLAAAAILATHAAIAAEAPSPAAAADPAPPALMTGDWGGVRSRWREQGLTLDFGVHADLLRNTGGGLDAGARTMWQVDTRIGADLGKLWGWEGLSAYLQVLDDRGGRINEDQVGSIMGVSNIEVPVATTRLFHAWVQQNFLDDAFSVLGGLYPIDSEFSVMDSAAIFLHPAYGALADLSLTRGPSIFNHSALGLRLRWQSALRTLYAQAAVLDGIPEDPEHPKRTAIRFAKGDGAFVIGEFGWTPLESGHLFEPLSPARPTPTPELALHEKYEGASKLAFGCWRYGNQVDDQFATDTNGDPLRRKSAGGYLLAERTLFSLGGEPGRDLTAFARYSRSTGHDTAIDRMENLGIRVRGPLAGRPDDAFGIAWTRGRLAPGYRSRLAAAGADGASAEEAGEITWRAALRKWLALQPNLQYVRNPGGDGATRPAKLIGIRLDVAL